MPGVLLTSLVHFRRMCCRVMNKRQTSMSGVFVKSNFTWRMPMQTEGGSKWCSLHRNRSKKSTGSLVPAGHGLGFRLLLLCRPGGGCSPAASPRWQRQPVHLRNGRGLPGGQSRGKVSRAGGERALNVPSGYYPVVPQVCPICGGETYYVPSEQQAPWCWLGLRHRAGEPTTGRLHTACAKAWQRIPGFIRRSLRQMAPCCTQA